MYTTRIASSTVDSMKDQKPSQEKAAVDASTLVATADPAQMRATDAARRGVMLSRPAAAATARVMAGMSTFKIWMNVSDRCR